MFDWMASARWDISRLNWDDDKHASANSTRCHAGITATVKAMVNRHWRQLLPLRLFVAELL
jgi:hypothetical protein